MSRLRHGAGLSLLLALAPAVPQARAHAAELGIVVVDAAHINVAAVQLHYCPPDQPSCLSPSVTYIDCTTAGDCSASATPAALGGHATNVASVVVAQLRRHEASGDTRFRLYSANSPAALAWLAGDETPGRSRARARNVQVLVNTLGAPAEPPPVCPTQDPTLLRLAADGVRLFWAAGNHGRNGLFRGMASDTPSQRLINCDATVVSVAGIHGSRLDSSGMFCSGLPTGSSRVPTCYEYPLHWKSNYLAGRTPVAANVCLPQLLGGSATCQSWAGDPNGSPELGTSYSSAAVAGAVAAIARRTGRGSYDAYQRLLAASPQVSFPILTDGPYYGQNVAYRAIDDSATSAALGSACPGAAPNVTSGMWYNPGRPGWGLSLNRHANAQVSVLWYTYTASGHPLWYYAQGQPNACGRLGLPVYRYRRVAGVVSAALVGSVELAFSSPDQAAFAWSMADGSKGAEPVSFIDWAGEHTASDGLWYDPSQSGWGYHIASQGTLHYVYAFLYDNAGDPVWLVGYADGNPASFSTPNMTAYVGLGLCPGCSGPGSAQPFAVLGSFAFQSTGPVSAFDSASLSGSLPSGAQLNHVRSGSITRLQ